MKIIREIDVDIDNIEIHTKSKLIVVRPKYLLDGDPITLTQHLELDDKSTKLIEELMEWIGDRLL